MLKNLLGKGNEREIAEMQAVLQQMHEAIRRFESLNAAADASAERLRQLGEPIDKAESSVDAITARLGELERRFEGMVQLSKLLDALDTRSEALAHTQERAESRIATSLQDAERSLAIFEELTQKVDLAMSLKDRLSAFLEVEKPFAELREQADALRGQVAGAGENLARLREQQDRLFDAHKLATTKMEALDRRRDELSRDLQDKERRVASVEQAIHGLDGVQHTVGAIRRDIDTLKALGDFVGQKTAALEAQRDAIEAALARADQLDRAMRQIDAGVNQQQENETRLTTLQDQVATLRSLHENVVERSGEMVQLQRETDDQARAIRENLSLVRDELKNAVERFEFETHGLESVSQRITDTRAALTDFEGRFRALSEASHAIEGLRSQTQALATQVDQQFGELRSFDQAMKELPAMERQLEDAHRLAGELAGQVARFEEARPGLEAALRDVEHLQQVHAMVKDALENTQLAHAEMSRVRDSHAETRSWLATTDQSLAELKMQASELRAMAPAIENLQGQVRHIVDSMTTIESRREFVEELRRRMSDLGAVAANLDERGRELQTRMEDAEQRFASLATRSGEAERTGKALAAMESTLQQAEQRADEIAKAVAGMETRCDSVEKIADRSRLLRDELAQRQKALADAAKDLERVSSLRQEAAADAQRLEETSKRLTSDLSSTDKRLERVGSVSASLEDRVAGLQSVEKRLAQFEDRLAKWDLVDQDVSRTLEQISGKQSTIEALQADLERMFAMAEKTAADVREITSAHREIEESRTLLEEVRTRLHEVRDSASSLEDREREMAKAEQRLARAEALLADVRSSLKALLEQRVVVDQAVEKAGSLQFLLKQAEALIDGLREERKMTARFRAAGAMIEDDAEEDEGFSRAA